MLLFVRHRVQPDQHVTLARRLVGAAVALLPSTAQKRAILRARELGILSDTDAESMIAERGLKGA